MRPSSANWAVFDDFQDPSIDPRMKPSVELAAYIAVRLRLRFSPDLLRIMYLNPFLSQHSLFLDVSGVIVPKTSDFKRTD